MKNYLIVLFAIMSSISFAQTEGVISESLEMSSTMLNKSVEYSVYLPHDYNTSQRAYPVLYLLHGYSGDETDWTQFGEVKRIADDLADDPDMTSMIIVMPDAGVDWYLNSYDGKVRYEDFFIEEFIPFIEKMYRIRSKKQFRAISGLSMGGYGTFIYAMKHPGLFVAAAPLSAAIWEDEEIISTENDSWDQYFGFIFGEGLQAADRLTPHLKENMPSYLVESVDAEKLNSVKWYIDCGDDDFLINGNMALHKAMREKEIAHEFRVRDGAHNWEYWRAALPEVLKFVSKSFHR